jgi:hypothetical protein
LVTRLLQHSKPATTQQKHTAQQNGDKKFHFQIGRLPHLRNRGEIWFKNQQGKKGIKIGRDERDNEGKHIQVERNTDYKFETSLWQRLEYVRTAWWPWWKSESTRPSWDQNIDARSRSLHFGKFARGLRLPLPCFALYPPLRLTKYTLSRTHTHTHRHR